MKKIIKLHQILNFPLRKLPIVIRMLFLFCTLSYSLIHNAQAAEGIFIYRQSAAHPEAGSVVMEYNSFKRWESLTQFNTPGGIVKVTKFQPLEILPYIDPQAKGAEIRSADANFWRQEYITYVTAHNTYPRSRVYLAKQVNQMKTVVDQLAAGNAWFEGKWVRDATVDVMKAERRSAEMKKANEKKTSEHNEKISKLIEAKNEELSTIQNQIKAVTGAIEDKKRNINQLQDAGAQETRAFNAEIMELLNKIK